MEPRYVRSASYLLNFKYCKRQSKVEGGVGKFTVRMFHLLGAICYLNMWVYYVGGYEGLFSLFYPLSCFSRCEIAN